ncbi:MAG: VOC family protein [Gemmatimonadetes bacterium]|nr:VOC family protein [Gemmatimonadota bacterium]
MLSGPRRIGEFCWINVLTPAASDAQAFFTAVLGWEYTALPPEMGGHLIKVGGEEVGGMWDTTGPNMPPSTPPGIGLMIRVESADAVSAKANELGGLGKPAFDVGPTGRMAETFDPFKAEMDVWQAGASPGMTADSMHHGTPSWIELATYETEKAGAFWSALFGWRIEKMSMPGMDYSVFHAGDRMVGGMMAITPEMGSFPSHWAVYMTVDDVDAAAAKATANGGSVFMPPVDIQTVGRMAGIASPQGVMFYVITYEMPA